jgi:hypothetical protein
VALTNVKWYVGSDQNVVIEGLRRWLPVSALTRSAGTATMTSEAHGLSVGDVIAIYGAEDTDYNGDFTVATVPTADTLTFSVATTAQTPAEGDIQVGVYLTGSSTVTATFSQGVSGTITFDYKMGSKGLFVGAIPDSNTFADGTASVATITATAGTGEVLKLTMSGTGRTYPY